MASLLVIVVGSQADADDYQVSVLDAAADEGNDPSELTFTVAVAPALDTFVLSATAVSSGTIQLAWSCQRTDVEGYLIELVDGGARDHVTTLPSTFGLFHHTGLPLEQAHSYQVSAYGSAGIVARSNTAAATTRSIPPNAHYVDSAATGSHTGGSWADAWTELPATLERGHTYFIADGTYPPYTFDDDQDGAEFIFIKKAVPSDHGASQGWSSDMGDGQAVFQHPSGTVTTAFSIRSGYLELDGQVGEGKAGHGFKMRVHELGGQGTAHHVVSVVDDTWSYTLLPYVNVRHCEMEHTGPANSQSSGRGFQIHSQAGLENSLLQSCYIHDIPGINIYLTRTEGMVVEHCYCARNHSDPVYHGEGVQTADAAHGVIIRFNTWEDIEGTAVIVARSDWKIHGNVAFTTPNYPNPGQYGGGVSAFVYAEGDITGVVVANNSIYGMVFRAAGNSAGVRIPTTDTTGNQVLNNMWVECERVRFTEFETMSHNYFCNNVDITAPETLGDAVQIETACPLLDPANEVFELSTETDPGMELWHPLLYDRNGNRYGEDGTWTRGAYEF